MLKLEDALVSVIIPCYQCSETIRRAVDSVIGQSIKPTEVILVDDCSGDDTLDILYEIQAEQPQGWIKVVSLPENSGPGTARNSGWKIATQPYLAFLDSDDAWHPRKIEIQHSYMNRNPDVALSGHGFMKVDDKITAVVQNMEFSTENLTFYEISMKRLLLSNCFSTPSVMLRRGLAQRFPDGKRFGEDYQLWLEICSAGLTCSRLDVPLTFLYKDAYGKSGLSAAIWKMEKGELDAYLNLFKKNYIGYPTVLLLFGWSLGKFLRRLIVLSIKKMSSFFSQLLPISSDFR